MKTPIIGLLVMALLGSIVLICYFCVFHRSSANENVDRFENIAKSSLDQRSYRGLKLPNKLTALLISDPVTDVSAAALTVTVGSINDPIPGLAHFLEHMLFMGSVKYPQENDYDKFIRSHAGNSNAYTAHDVTNYHFQVGSQHLSPALDRFAQFFINPLFSPSAIEREVNAVNSEFKRNVPNDDYRLYQLEYLMSKANHSYNHFSCGNLETLYKEPKAKGISIRDELLKFYAKWYSSNIMNLVVIGKENLDQLEEIVRSSFDEVKNKNVKPPDYSFENHPWGPDEVRREVFAVPVVDVYKLKLIFPTPPVESQYKTAPADYIISLLGHRGRGGLVSTLKARSLCSGVSIYYNNPSYAFFTMEFSLTEEAVNRINATVDEIITLTFQHIELIKIKGIQRWIFDENKKIDEVDFKYKDKDSPLYYASGLSAMMHVYPMEDILQFRYIHNEWNPSLIEKYLSYLKPDNMNIMVVSKKFKDIANETEHWYGTKYRIETLQNSLIEKWNTTRMTPELQLPPPNNFMTENFSLYPLDNSNNTNPYIIQESSASRFWFKQDDRFKLPKLTINFQILSPIASSTPKNRNLLEMFIRLFKQTFSEIAFSANKAGLEWSIESSDYGIDVGLSGFNEKLPVLLETLISNLTNFVVDEKRLKVLRELYIRDLKNFEARSLTTYTFAHLFNLIYEHQWTRDEYLAATDALHSEKVEKFKSDLFARIYIQGLIHGNCNDEQAKNIVSMIESSFQSSVGATPEELPLLRQIEMQDGSNLRYELSNKYHSHSSIYTYYQCSKESALNNSIMQLFAQIIKEPCFNILRTQEQLGYSVGCNVFQKSGEQGLLITVESEKHPFYLDSRIESFLEHVLIMLDNMTDNEFEIHKKALATTKLVKPKQLDALSNKYWGEIKTRLYNFDRAEIEVEKINSLKKKDIIDFYYKSLHKLSSKRRKLAITVTSEVTKPKIPENITIDGVLISSINEFKMISKFSSLPSPYIKVPPLGSKKD